MAVEDMVDAGEKLWSPGSAAAKLVPVQLVPENFGPMLKMLAGLKGGRD